MAGQTCEESNLNVTDCDDTDAGFLFLSRGSVEGEGKSCGAFPQHSARARAVSVHIDILTSLFIVSKKKKQDRRTTAWTRCELAGRLQVRFQHEDGRAHRDQQCSRSIRTRNKEERWNRGMLARKSLELVRRTPGT